MNWTHVPDSLLADFVTGDLHTLDAVRVATHLDGCPACAARAAAAEPLAQAFASVDDPEPPLELAAAIVEQALVDRRRSPSLEPAVAAGLLAAAVLLMLVLGAPAELAATVGALGDVATSVLRTVEAPVSLVAPIWVALAMFTFAAAAMAGRRLERGTTAWR